MLVLEGLDQMDKVRVLDCFGYKQVALVQFIHCPHPVGRGRQSTKKHRVWQVKVEHKAGERQETRQRQGNGLLHPLSRVDEDLLGHSLPEERSVRGQALQLLQRIG